MDLHHDSNSGKFTHIYENHDFLVIQLFGVCDSCSKKSRRRSTLARDVQELLADLEARLAAAAGLVAVECQWMLVLNRFQWYGMVLSSIV